MKLASLSRFDNNARRLGEIVATLGKYGLADWLSGINYDWLTKHLRTDDGQLASDLTREERIRLSLTELGPTFIKLGQVMSTRADLIGDDLAEELGRLQADTPSDSSEEVRQTFVAEFGQPPEDLYESFDYEAMASASIGQVHRATLKNGRQVVAKVQHANIEENIIRDLNIFVGLAELAEKHVTGLRSYQPIATATEFQRILLRELDFSHERKHLEIFRANFADDPGIHVPAAFPELSTQRVLTMEMLDGVTVSRVDEIRDSTIDLTSVARRGAEMYLEMVFRDGFYHADPHPGNLMILPDGAIGILDCGMVGRMDRHLREEIEAMLFATTNQDADALTDIVIRIGSVPPQLDRNALRSDMDNFVTEYAGQSLQEFDLSGALSAMVGIIRRYQIILPPNCSLLLKVLIMLEGTARLLQPDFSLAEVIHPFYVKSMEQRFMPRNLLENMRRRYHDWSRLIDSLPRDMHDIVERMRSGTFDVHLDHRRLDSIVNRLVLGVLTAALFMGSSQIVSQKIPPVIFGELSVLGASGCGIAMFLGFRLISAIKKSGDIRPKDDR